MKPPATAKPGSGPEPRSGQRIAKLLARAGIASRREIERMIADGRVALEGRVLDTPATLLASLRGVTVDGKPVKEPAPARLFCFHKPAGLLTTERDPAGRPTIYDRLPRDLPRLVPVGRLDLNTEGLLLLTTDGELKRQLELPSTGVTRVYRARTFGAVSQEQLEQLIHGVTVEGVRYGSIDANLERRTGRNQWIEMKLTEGKNREVRRILEFLGLQVSRLIRTAYGPFVLADLPIGAVSEVRQHDLVVFRNSLKTSLPRSGGEGDGGGAAPKARRPAKPEGRPAPNAASHPRVQARPDRKAPSNAASHARAPARQESRTPSKAAPQLRAPARPEGRTPSNAPPRPRGRGGQPSSSRKRGKD